MKFNLFDITTWVSVTALFLVVLIISYEMYKSVHLYFIEQAVKQECLK